MLSIKYFDLMFIITFIFGIIPFTVASDCDIITVAYGYLKGSLLDDISIFKDCCNAEEINCDDSKHITEIVIENFRSSEGNIGMALKALGNLKYLTKLKIADTETKVGLVIPNEIGEFKSLKSLILGNNKAENDKTPGAGIPESIGNLKNLKELHLHSNNLIGTIPKEISNLSKLEVLNLEDNKLTGTVPYKLNKLCNLKELYLNNNKELKGYVPLIEGINSFTCNYQDTNLCYLKSAICQSSDGCTIKDIQDTNKENGASDLSIYESEVVKSNDSIFSTRNLAYGGGGLIGFIVLCSTIFACWKSCCCDSDNVSIFNKKKEKVSAGNIDNSGTNTGFMNTGTIGNISNSFNTNCGNVTYNITKPSTQYTQPTEYAQTQYPQTSQYVPSSQYVPPPPY